ncbi:MAG: SGNH/GDSL hydrolase family protein [Clostridia bacterium]|nr:SGNH/GDSL hydrolase family protein [Clostridia bacterium]
MNKKLKILISIILIVVFVAGGYVANMFGFFNRGNYGEYSLENTETIFFGPIRSKTVIFLGSSVTYGYGSMGVSFADYLEKTDGIYAIKEAVSGTTLVDIKDNSYVSRMKAIDKDIKAEAFVCQLSTNDATKEMPLGKISESYDINDFDTQTIAGAIEYIIVYAKNTWNCPVVFYTQAKYDSDHYAKMVDLLLEIQKKWDITVIDLWNDAEFNNITEDQRKLYLIDHIHPTKAGYRNWWLPKFQEALYELI